MGLCGSVSLDFASNFYANPSGYIEEYMQYIDTAPAAVTVQDSLRYIYACASTDMVSQARVESKMVTGGNTLQKLALGVYVSVMSLVDTENKFTYLATASYNAVLIADHYKLIEVDPRKAAIWYYRAAVFFSFSQRQITAEKYYQMSQETQLMTTGEAANTDSSLYDKVHSISVQNIARDVAQILAA